MHFVDASDSYEVHVSAMVTLAQQYSSDEIEVCHRIVFNFYEGLLHIKLGSERKQ